MSEMISARRVLTPAGILEGGRILLDGDRIAAVEPYAGPYDGEFLTPGFIDVHTHGGDGFDVMSPTEEGFAAWTRALAAHGVIGILAGVYTSAVPRMQACMDFYARAMEEQAAGKYPGARLLGVHLEGPFLSVKRPGAMDTRRILSPDVQRYQEICHGHEDAVRLMAIAAEEEGSAELIAYCLSRGVRLNLGHSDATAAQARAAFARGVSGVTHFFNAARPIHHREPGLLTEALLARGVYAEAICDLQHVHAEALRLIHAMKGPERMMVISDGVSTTGLPDGEYGSDDPAAGGRYIVRGGAAYIASGSLAGGGAYADRAVRNLASIGIPVEDALRMASQTPARYLGLADLGEIRPGARADLALLDGEGFVRTTWIGGTAL